MATFNVTFDRSRDGGPIARVEGKVAFPERNGAQPGVGETWEVEIAGTNPRGTVHFLRLVRKVEVQPLVQVAPPVMSNEPATILVVLGSFHPEHRVLVDGEKIPYDLTAVSARSVSFDVPSRAKMRDAAARTLRLTAGAVYVLVYESYNARSAPSVVNTQGLIPVYEYGDGHGMKWAALYRLNGEAWQVDWDVPRHHSHGWHKRRAVGSRIAYEWQSEQRVLEEAPQV